MYALTGNPQWLATAQLNADYWLEHTDGTDPVPPNDFDEPDPVRRWESSAACAAGGLIMLGSLVADDDLAQRYHDHAEATIARLCEPEFVAHEDPGRACSSTARTTSQAWSRRERDVGRVLFSSKPLPGWCRHMTTTIRRPPLGERLTTEVIAVPARRSVSALAPVCDVLVEEGILSLELTLTTPRLLDALPELIDRYADAR